jgi:hypothetical protein
VPPAKKRANVDENEITVNGYETPKEAVGVVKVEDQAAPVKGPKKRGATDGAVGRVPPAKKRANVDENEITVNGYETPKEAVGVVKVEPKKKGRKKRAKCDHGRDKRICRECGGSGICPHGRIKKQCRECGGSAICVHGRQKQQCRECGGSAICPHGKRKYRCKECNGAAIGKVEKRAAKEKGPKKHGATDGADGPVPPAVKRVQKRAKCDHGRDKRICRECGGSGICPHGRIKRQCRECGGSGICVHGRQKQQCRECGGSAICPHGKRKDRCKECGGSSICPHGRQQYQCKECGGSGICTHGRVKNSCKECGLAKVGGQ